MEYLSTIDDGLIKLALLLWGLFFTLIMIAVDEPYNAIEREILDYKSHNPYFTFERLWEELNESGSTMRYIPKIILVSTLTMIQISLMYSIIITSLIWIKWLFFKIPEN